MRTQVFYVYWQGVSWEWVGGMWGLVRLPVFGMVGLPVMGMAGTSCPARRCAGRVQERDTDVMIEPVNGQQQAHRAHPVV